MPNLRRVEDEQIAGGNERRELGEERVDQNGSAHVAPVARHHRRLAKTPLPRRLA